MEGGAPQLGPREALSRWQQWQKSSTRLRLLVTILQQRIQWRYSQYTYTLDRQNQIAALHRPR